MEAMTILKAPGLPASVSERVSRPRRVMYHFALGLIIRARRIEEQKEKVRRAMAAAINIIHLFEWAEFYDSGRRLLLLLFSPPLGGRTRRTDATDGRRAAGCSSMFIPSNQQGGKTGRDQYQSRVGLRESENEKIRLSSQLSVGKSGFMPPY